MMTLTTDCMTPQDVYSSVPLTGSSASDYAANEITIRLAVENSPMSLSRVFGLIGTVFIVPVSSGTSQREDGAIEVQLDFSDADPRKIDLLCRKLSQLTETASLSIDG